MTLNIEWPHEDWRGAQATMHRIAAEIEERSRGERWVVIVASGAGSLGRNRLGGFVGVELADGTSEEAARSEVLLKAISVEWVSR